MLFRSLEETKKINETVNKIRKDKKVIAVLLFGGYARKREYARDIDLCVILDPEYSKRQGAYELTKKRLKFLTYAPDKFDIQIFQLLPLYIRIKILKEGKILYCKDMRKIYDLAYRTIKEYEDFKPRYKDYIEAVAR